MNHTCWEDWEDAAGTASPPESRGLTGVCRAERRGDSWVNVETFCGTNTNINITADESNRFNIILITKEKI